jgi:hypothetical protein
MISLGLFTLSNKHLVSESTRETSLNGSVTSPDGIRTSARLQTKALPGQVKVKFDEQDELQRLILLQQKSNSFQPEQALMASPTASFVQLYYSFFHRGHPIILPPKYLVERRKTVPQLMAAIHYIGASFTPSAPTELLHLVVKKELFKQTTPANGFTVQALILYAIALHSNDNADEAAKILDRAIDMALKLGMNFETFSKACGENDPVIEESWRRTWWELYYLEGLIAGIHQAQGFRLFNEPTDVPLPCEEVQYLTGNIPPIRSLDEFDNRDFSETPLVYSSFAYRIEAIRVLGRVLAVGIGPDPNDPAVEGADTCLINWGLNLPKEKSELLGPEGKVDEMLFQAHMVINAATVYLHRPRSHLAMSAVPDDTSCTPARSYAFPVRALEFHTAKAIRAADTISKLLTLPTPLIRHTPFLTCVITMAAIVHLSACSFILYGDQGTLAKERIRLSIGALKTLDEVWPVAGQVLNQVKGVAREVFALQPTNATQHPMGYISENDIMRFVEEENVFENLGETDYYGLPGLEWDGSDTIVFD